jgi:hypothetical protein
MLIDILLLASSEVILTPDGQSVKTTAVASAAPAA